MKKERPKIARKADEAIKRSLEDLVPTMNLPPSKIEIIKEQVNKVILDVEETYNGKFSQVPTKYLARTILKYDFIDGSELIPDSIDMLRSMAESLESVSGYRKPRIASR